MTSEFADCIVLNTRMAARAVTRRYDSKLRPYGITAAQFSLLVSIARAPDRSVTDLAEALGMERTTLTRNLELLERKGLAQSRPGGGGNVRVSALSARGRSLVEELTPHWRKAQGEMRELLGGDGFEAALASLKRLSKL